MGSRRPAGVAVVPMVHGDQAPVRQVACEATHEASPVLPGPENPVADERESLSLTEDVVARDETHRTFRGV